MQMAVYELSGREQAVNLSPNEQASNFIILQKRGLQILKGPTSKSKASHQDRVIEARYTIFLKFYTKIDRLKYDGLSLIFVFLGILSSKNQLCSKL